jgi:hypothetical protein
MEKCIRIYYLCVIPRFLIWPTLKVTQVKVQCFSVYWCSHWNGRIELHWNDCLWSLDVHMEIMDQKFRLPNKSMTIIHLYFCLVFTMFMACLLPVVWNYIAMPVLYFGLNSTYYKEVVDSVLIVSRNNVSRLEYFNRLSLISSFIGCYWLIGIKRHCPIDNRELWIQYRFVQSKAFSWRVGLRNRNSGLWTTLGVIALWGLNPTVSG